MVHLIRNAKRSFYQNSINNNLENPKNLWRIIRSLALSKCYKLPNHLTVNDKNYHDHYDFANLFLMSTLSISLPLFSETTFLIHPTGTVLQIMLIQNCHLEYPVVSPLSLKISSELASSSYLLARLLGWTNLVAIF